MKLAWDILWLATYPCFAKPLLGMSVKGRRRLARGGQILASNHVSNIDPLIVGWAAAREVHFLAKQELFDASRWFALLIRSLNAHPVRRGLADRAALEHCSELLRHDQTLVLFPEGTRSRTGELARFRPGVGMLAIRNRVPVVPTRITGMDRSWFSYQVDFDFRRRGWRKKPKGRVPIRVSFGEPVRPEGFADSREGFGALAAEVEARVRGLGAGAEPRAKCATQA